MIKCNRKYLLDMFFTVIIGLLFSIPNIFFAQGTFKEEQNRYIRVHNARENREHQIDSLFRSLDISYPPRELLIITFKDEQILELWAKPESLETFIMVKRYDFTAFSGNLGPKRKRGDLQIPEGFYHITHFNPTSTFHLSLKINYPNESDRILGQKNNLGGDIFIHGSMVTIGCIPIGNNGIEELYITCVDTKSRGQKNIPVYIFPARMDSIGMVRLKQIAGVDTILFSFWKNLKQGHDIFYTLYKKLEFQVDDNGKYIYSNPNPNNPNNYSWLSHYDKKNALMNRIEVPDGYERTSVPANTFAHWLRNLPLKQGNPLVYLYNNSKKSYQDGHCAIIDIDVGSKDLQQCADAIIRFYAEYLYSKNLFDEIKFKITNGDIIKYRRWISGYRPRVTNNQITWHHTAPRDSSYNSLKNYLDFVFMYAGTYSLNQQLYSIDDIINVKIGDIVIQGGFPGHAILIADMAINTQTQEKIFLLCQSYMPAQDIHILKNLRNSELNPWYKLNFEDTLYTPEWNFTPLESAVRAF